MISTKVAVIIFVLVSLAGTGALAITLDVQARERRTSFRATSVDFFQLLATSITPSLASQRHDRVQTIFDNIATHPGRFMDVRSLEVVGRDGRIFADLDPRRFNLKETRRSVYQDSKLAEPTLQALDHELLLIVVPIRVTYPLGVLRAVISEKRLLTSLKQEQLNAGVLVLSTSFLLALALYLVLRKTVAQRIVKLAEIAGSLREGNLHVRATVDADDEISQLGESFNQMAEAIRVYTENLEKLVKERTAALQEANERLAQLAITDPLTALFNRRHFEERAARDLEVAKRAGRSFAVVVMDVDLFKQINDRFGHPVGDAVLRSVSSVLLDNARAVDLAARIGGEEFAIAMPDATAEEATLAAERIRKHFETTPPAGASELKEEVVTASFGVAAFPQHGDSLRVLLSAADAALYRAKQAGRNRVEQASQKSLEMRANQ